MAPNPASDLESAYLYNPAAIAIDDKSGSCIAPITAAFISIVGLSWSEGGYSFIRYTKPVLYPTEDYESHGT